MKKRLTALIVVAMMAILAACGSSSSGEEKKAPEVSSEQPAVEEKTEEPVAEEPAEEKPVPVEAEEAELAEEEIVEYTVDDILDMLNKNPLNASRTLKDKRIFLTGSVGNIDASGDYISLIGSDSFSLDSVMCYIKNDEQLEFVAGIEKGDYVRILGTVKDVGEVMGYSINIEEIEKSDNYPRYYCEDQNFDYTGYVKYSITPNTCVWIPESWDGFKTDRWNELGMFDYRFTDEGLVRSECGVLMLAFDDSDEAKSTLEDPFTSLEDMVINTINRDDYASAIGSEFAEAGDYEKIYINDCPTIYVPIQIDNALLEMYYTITSDAILMMTSCFSDESIHVNEAQQVILSVNQDFLLDSVQKKKEAIDAELQDEIEDAVEEAKETGPLEGVDSSAPTSSATVSYESIYNEYAEKIRAATPGLIEEYKKKAAGNNDGITGLATISTEQVEKLAEIVNEGVEEMAEVMLYKGSGKYDEYEEWAGKLYDVYEEEAGKIMDEYIGSF